MDSSDFCWYLIYFILSFQNHRKQQRNRKSPCLKTFSFYQHFPPLLQIFPCLLNSYLVQSSSYIHKLFIALFSIFSPLCTVKISFCSKSNKVKWMSLKAQSFSHFLQNRANTVPVLYIESALKKVDYFGFSEIILKFILSQAEFTCPTY